MIVTVRHFDFVERAPGIARLVEINVGDVDSVRVLGVGDQVHVVPGALLIGTAVVHQIPSFAAVIGAIQTAFMGFHEHVDAIGISGHRNPDSAVGSLGQSVFFEPLPGAATVVGTVKPASGAAADQAPGRPMRFP